jgi:hypothetical protein
MRATSKYYRDEYSFLLRSIYRGWRTAGRGRFGTISALIRSHFDEIHIRVPRIESRITEPRNHRTTELQRIEDRAARQQLLSPAHPFTRSPAHLVRAAMPLRRTTAALRHTRRSIHSIVYVCSARICHPATWRYATWQSTSERPTTNGRLPTFCLRPFPSGEPYSHDTPPCSTVCYTLQVIL